MFAHGARMHVGVARGVIFFGCVFGWMTLGLHPLGVMASEPSARALELPRVPGELIVKYRDAAPSAAGLRALGLAAEPLKTDARLMRVRVAEDSKLAGVMRGLAADPRIEFVEPNYIYRTSASGIPNDPMMSKLWNLSNEGQKDSQGNEGKAGADIRVAPVWAAGNVGSRNIVVAVIDTGIDWKHPDLKDNLYVNPGEAGALATNGKDDDGNGFIDDTHGWNFAGKSRKSADDQGHGTHCAGTIGGTGNNGVGVVGVNWEVKLLPVKFLDSEGSGSLADAVESINYATLMKVNVMSNSWGGGGFSQALLEAIQKARDAGILFVAAAGNDGGDNDAAPTYPASYAVDNVVSVAALDNKDGLADFSNYGRTLVHVAAPGVRILSTMKGGSYETLSGTSMACPHVSGVAALMLAGDSNLNYSDIKSRLIRTSEPVSGLKRKVVSRGRVNAFNAVNNIETPSNEPDPAAWVDVAVRVESRHPYADWANEVYSVTEAGAKFIRVVFTRIDTEAKYDFVKIEDSSGNELDSYHGKLTQVTSEYVAGDTLKIRLKSDSSNTGWGFLVEKIQVIR